MINTVEKTIQSRVRGTELQLKIGRLGQATLGWSDMSKGVKEVSKLACGYLKKSSRYREQSLQRPEVGMCLV